MQHSVGYANGDLCLSWHDGAALGEQQAEPARVRVGTCPAECLVSSAGTGERVSRSLGAPWRREAIRRRDIRERSIPGSALPVTSSS